MKLSPEHFSVRYKIHGFALAVLLIAIVALCLIAKTHGVSPILQIATPLVAFAMAWILVSIPGRFVRNEMAMFLCFILLMALGFAAYINDVPPVPKPGPDGAAAEEPQWYVKLLWPITSLLSVFFPSRGSYEVVPGDSRFLYWCFHFLGYVYFAWFSMAILGRKILNWTSLLLIPTKCKNIIWGYSDVGLELAKDILNHCGKGEDEPIFILGKNDPSGRDVTEQSFDKISEANIIAVCAEFGRMRKRIEGRRHYFITEDQNENIKMALKVIDWMSERKKADRWNTHIFVRCEQDWVGSMFQHRLNTVNRRIEVHLFNQSDLTARQFIASHPTLGLCKYPDLRGNGRLSINHDTLTVSGHAEILIIGLGWTGYEILKKTVCDSRFLGKNEIRITVIDDSLEESGGNRADIFETAKGLGITIRVNPEFNGSNVRKAGSELFYQWLKDDDSQILGFNRIIVAIGDDERNIKLAMDIHWFRAQYLDAVSARSSDHLPEKVFAYTKELEKYTAYSSDISPIMPFGGTKGIYTYNILVAEQMDTVAKLVNYVYSRNDISQVTQEEIESQLRTKYNDIEREWDKAGIFNQDSSRAVAQNIINMVTLCGGKAGLEHAINDPVLLERLAEMEHLRWNAFHIMKGIKPWPMDEVYEINGSVKGKLYFYKQLQKHICLVPFDRVDEASRRINMLKGREAENYKESDRRITRHFPIFLNYYNK